MLAGYGCVGMGHAGFLGKWGGEREREKWFKIFFFPASACAGKKENSAVQNDTVSVFFFLKKKRNVIWKNLKMDYDKINNINPS